jgi:large subunit ribosomal protein L20
MSRVKGGVVHNRKRKKILKKAKGFMNSPGTQYRLAVEFTRKAGAYATAHRKQRQRHFRTLWVTRLSAALRARGLQYNRFIPALISAGVELNRKMLSELAIGDPAAFDAVVALVKPHITGPAPKKKLALA